MNVLGPISDPSEIKKWVRSAEGLAALKGIPGTAQGL
jgi:hypothetical protein